MKRVRLTFMPFVLVAVIAALFLYAYRSEAIAKLNAWKLIPQPEHFTELYLDDYANLAGRLPKSIAPGTTISFSFAIHNLEGRAMKYPYKVSIVGDMPATTTVDTGTIYLPEGAATSTRETYTFRRWYRSATVYIELTQLNQSLHFSIPNRN